MKIPLKNLPRVSQLVSMCHREIIEQRNDPELAKMSIYEFKKEMAKRKKKNEG